MTEIDRFIQPERDGYKWFVYVVENGHVLAQGYHTSMKIAGRQMDTAFLHALEEWLSLNGA